jgi:signal peptidase I
MTLGRFLRDLLIVLAVISVVVWAATRWLVAPFSVDGRSMEPTLRDGDRVLVDLWSYGRRPPHAGEVVVLVGPSGDDLVKRVAREPYPGTDPYPPAQLETESPLELSFVVLGDNPEESGDSRTFGRIPRHRVRGRVRWRYWPLTRLGSIE